jgi:hypothetical protein
MHKYITYAWRGSGPQWDTPKVAVLGGSVGGFVFWLLGIKLPQAILDNPGWGAVVSIALGAIVGVFVVFIGRLCCAPIHFAYEDYGGFRAFLKQRMGRHMLPFVLIAAAIALSILSIGVGGAGILLVFSRMTDSADINEKTNLVFELQRLTLMQARFKNAEAQAASTSNELFKRIIEYYKPKPESGFAMVYPYQKTQSYFNQALRGVQDNAKSGIFVPLIQMASQDIPGFNPYTGIDGDAACETDECRVTFRREKSKHQAIFREIGNIDSKYVRKISEIQQKISTYSGKN